MPTSGPLTVDKVVNKVAPVVGEQVTYTITAHDNNSSSGGGLVPGATDIIGVTPLLGSTPSIVNYCSGWTPATPGGSPRIVNWYPGHINNSTFTLTSNGINIWNVYLTVVWTDNLGAQHSSVLSQTSFVGGVNTFPDLPSNAVSVQSVLSCVDYSGATGGTFTVEIVYPDSSGVPPSTTFNVTDTFPACLTGLSWTRNLVNATATGPASGTGAINDNVTTQGGGNVTYTATGTVTAACLGGPTVNTATINGTNVTATFTATTPTADIVNTKTALTTSVAPGSVAEFEWTIQNNGPSPVTGMPISDPIPVNVSLQQWQLAAASTGVFSGPFSGTGAINGTVNIPSGGFVKFLVKDTLIGSVAPPVVVLRNTATVTIPGSIVDPDPTNNDPAEATVPIVYPGSVVAQKLASPSSVVAGSTLTYTITVENTGFGQSTVTINDTMPPDFQSWSWTSNVTLGVVTGVTGSGTGAIAETIVMGPQSKIVYVASGDIKFVGYSTQVINTANITSSSGVPPVSPRVEVPILKPVGKPLVTKIPNKPTVEPGEDIVWTITVENNKQFALDGVRIQDGIAPGLSSWSWTATQTGGVTGFLPSGTVGINDVLNIPPGSKLTYTVRGKTSGCTVSSITNTVFVTNNDGVLVDTINSTVAVGGAANISFTKSSSQASVVAGGTVNWVFKAKNNGSNVVSGYRVVDDLPVGVVSRTYTTSNTGVSGAPNSSSGAFDHALTFQPGGEITFNISDVVGVNVTGTVCNKVDGVPAYGWTGATSVSSNQVTVLGAAGTRVLEGAGVNGAFIGSYENDGCGPVKVRVTVKQPVKLCSAATGPLYNNWSVVMEVVVRVDGYDQPVVVSPRFDFDNRVGDLCVSGLLLFDEVFDVGVFGRLEVFRRTVGVFPDGVFVDAFNRIELGVGVVIVSD
jgi:uncharacterized repeat protein (TIGR01451 family)